MSIFRISLKNAFTYRMSVFSTVVGSVLNMLISMALWQYVYQYDVDMRNYMILYVILSNIISIFYSRSMSGEIGGKVLDGSFALELIKPVSFVYLGYMRMLGRILADALMRGVPLLLFFSPLIVMKAHMIHFEAIGLFIMIVVLGHLLYSVLYALIGFIAFICFEIWPFERLLGDTIRFLSGSFIPLALFPGWLKNIAVFFPFRFLYSFPIELLLGNMKNEEIVTNIAIMCIWITGLAGVFALLFKRTVNAFVVQGG